MLAHTTHTHTHMATEYKYRGKNTNCIQYGSAFMINIYLNGIASKMAVHRLCASLSLHMQTNVQCYKLYDNNNNNNLNIRGISFLFSQCTMDVRRPRKDCYAHIRRKRNSYVRVLTFPLDLFE